MGFGVSGGVVTVASGQIDQPRFEQFRATIWMERLARKGFLVTRQEIGGDHVTVVNTHLTANYARDWSAENGFTRVQIKELDQLAAAVRRLPERDLVIVAGDFNFPASAPQFEEFMAASGLARAMDWSAVPADARGFHEIDNVHYRPPAGRRVAARAELCFQDQIRLRADASRFPPTRRNRSRSRVVNVPAAAAPAPARPE